MSETLTAHSPFENGSAMSVRRCPMATIESSARTRTSTYTADDRRQRQLGATIAGERRCRVSRSADSERSPRLGLTPDDHGATVGIDRDLTELFEQAVGHDAAGPEIWVELAGRRHGDTRCECHNDTERDNNQRLLHKRYLPGTHGSSRPGLIITGNAVISPP